MSKSRHVPAPPPESVDPSIIDEPLSDADLLLTPEDIAERRKRRLWLLALLATVMLAVGGWFCLTSGAACSQGLAGT